MHWGWWCALLAVVLLATASTQAAQQEGHHNQQTDQGGHQGSVPHLHTKVLSVLPHDHSLFTEGLETADGTLYESSGQYGQSLLRASDPRTGRVYRQVRLAPNLFGEGIAVVGNRIWQLTWQEGVAIQYERSGLRPIRTVHYNGQGWGLCYDGRRLVMSDGSDRLTFRDPNTFAVVGSVQVTYTGTGIDNINELECVGGQVYANVWQTQEILRIDPTSGHVTAVIDASGLLPANERAGTDVLNGIAAVPGTDEFLLTGKWWPHMYLVRFVPS
jgi:glutaminyl-peptide cyclotransferase